MLLVAVLNFINGFASKSHFIYCLALQYQDFAKEKKIIIWLHYDYFSEYEVIDCIEK